MFKAKTRNQKLSCGNHFIALYEFFAFTNNHLTLKSLEFCFIYLSHHELSIFIIFFNYMMVNVYGPNRTLFISKVVWDTKCIIYNNEKDTCKTQFCIDKIRPDKKSKVCTHTYMWHFHCLFWNEVHVRFKKKMSH